MKCITCELAEAYSQNNNIVPDLSDNARNELINLVNLEGGGCKLVNFKGCSIGVQCKSFIQGSQASSYGICENALAAHELICCSVKTDKNESITSTNHNRDNFFFCPDFSRFTDNC